MPPAADAQENTLQKVHLNFIRILLQQKIVLPGEQIVQLIAVAVSPSLSFIFPICYLNILHKHCKILSELYSDILASGSKVNKVSRKRQIANFATAFQTGEFSEAALINRFALC